MAPEKQGNSFRVVRVKGSSAFGKAINRLAESVIVFSCHPPIGEHKEIMAGNADAVTHRFIPLQLFHKREMQ